MNVDNQSHTYDTQPILLEMMKDVHAFCESRDIAYSLCSGTLLGAIRHNGFIPWDDDIDIMMDRSNYERFLGEFQKSCDYVLKRELWIWRIQKSGHQAERILLSYNRYLCYGSHAR